jgi:hypothetical protein
MQKCHTNQILIMKKLLTVTGLFLSLLTFAQGSPDYGGGLKFNLNPEGTKYMRFIAWNQVWLRSSDLNPGTMIGDEPATTHEDIGLASFTFISVCSNFSSLYDFNAYWNQQSNIY